MPRSVSSVFRRTNPSTTEPYDRQLCSFYIDRKLEVMLQLILLAVTSPVLIDIKACLWLLTARMEMDYDLKQLANSYKFLPCILNHFFKSQFCLFSLGGIF